MCAALLPQIICFPEQIKASAGHLEQAALVGYSVLPWDVQLDLQLPWSSAQNVLAYANALMKLQRLFGMWLCIFRTRVCNKFWAHACIQKPVQGVSKMSLVPLVHLKFWRLSLVSCSGMVRKTNDKHWKWSFFHCPHLNLYMVYLKHASDKINSVCRCLWRSVRLLSMVVFDIWSGHTFWFILINWWWGEGPVLWLSEGPVLWLSEDAVL